MFQSRSPTAQSGWSGVGPRARANEGGARKKAAARRSDDGRGQNSGPVYFFFKMRVIDISVDNFPSTLGKWYWGE